MTAAWDPAYVARMLPGLRTPAGSAEANHVRMRGAADQLEAAAAEIERLTSALPNWDLRQMTEQRDALLHQVMGLRARLTNTAPLKAAVFSAALAIGPANHSEARAIADDSADRFVSAEQAAAVCSTCNDTHQMDLGDRMVMCTRCPTPCPTCAGFGRGAYCRTTPCACGCHARQR